ncbi:P-loop containing nucleoside triphosphate hydrolase protein [Armillaria mellea]|nr:P-loop containing nucleoside triphosphate hydrolase protein [Armillaria mellea]
MLRNAFLRLPIIARPLFRRCYATENIRNIAIIAHVDHGKTTLVDQLLRQSGTSTAGANEPPTDRVMDSNDLEKERGITILSKCTSIKYRDNLINIVDTPGHADFGGEVERVLSMVDAVALVVDATEGPMTQTRFVLGKALARGLKSLVVLNKADRPTSRPAQVESDLFDLFATLGATDDQMDYPVVYASAKEGWATFDQPPPAPTNGNMQPLFDLILSQVPPPTHLSSDAPFSMLTVQIESDSYVGMLYLGRIQSGQLRVGDTLWALDAEGNKVGDGKVKKIFSRAGLERVEREEAAAGEIVSIAGIKIQPGIGGVNVSLVSPGDGVKPLKTTPIDPPTISVRIYPNDSPVAGKEGSKLTSQVIRERLLREAETNVALRVLPGATAESLELRGRGVLHLGVLFETLRREGFEFTIGPPKAVMIPDPDNPGQNLEPIEDCVIIVKEEWAGTVIQKLTMRKGEMKNYEPAEPGFMRIEMEVPARGLLGYMAGEFKNDVHGEGTLNHIFLGYMPYKGPIDTGRNGSLISMSLGESSAYAIAPLQARGVMFIHPTTNVYPGMVIGECSKASDLYVNPCEKKKLTNIRAAGADEKLVIASPRIMSLEESIAYMADDELVEVTPKAIRLRKAILDQKKRMRGGK